jgi:hypothetical protein
MVLAFGLGSTVALAEVVPAPLAKSHAGVLSADEL